MRKSVCTSTTGRAISGRRARTSRRRRCVRATSSSSPRTPRTPTRSTTSACTSATARWSRRRTPARTCGSARSGGRTSSAPCVPTTADPAPGAMGTQARYCRRMSDRPRLRVAVVFGGRSSEHAISCVSAGSVLAAIDRDRYDVVPIGITTEGRWVLTADDPTALALSGGQLPAVDPTGTALVLPGDPTTKGIVVLDQGEVPDDLGAVDVVFPLLHGPYGEDGTLQGLLELA